MIFELSAGSFGDAASLFQDAWFDRALIDAVFEGRQRGRIFVDRESRPRAALLCRTYDYYVAGDPGAFALRQFMEEAPAEAGVFERLYGYVPLSEAWVRALLEDSGGRLEVIPRRGFTIAGAAGISRARRPRSPSRDAAVMPIDRTLAAQIDTDLAEHIGLLWGGYEDFASGGFGFCAIVGGTVASVAYTVAVSARHANIVVATAAAFRRQGLATLTCSAFIAACEARGLIVEWGSDASNAASVALAQRLGGREGPPFSELGFPGRAQMAGSRGLWAKQEAPMGTSRGPAVWRRQ